MVFRLAIAVIVGVLYTAGKNWTGLWTPRRGELAALTCLWLAGRLAMIFISPIFAAIIDLLFLPLAALAMYRVLQKSGNRRNLFLVALLGLLTVANAVFHAACLGWINLAPTTAIQAAILIIVIIESIIGARVIPMFTSNGAPGTRPIVNPRRDRVSLILTVVASVSWLLSFPAVIVASLAVAAACSQLLRLAGWQPHRTVHNPMLWILHLSYAWIPIGFILMALSALQIVSASAAFHALTVGSMAGLIVGMITRTALGHTGRTLTSGRAELAMYLLIQAGAIFRLLAAVGGSGAKDGALVTAALCWSCAFILYIIVYAPYLLTPRVDGREG